MEKRITLNADGLKLEALFNPLDSECAVIIAHPHPLYGGNMENPVVCTVKDTFTDLGYATLRFNFRGVGESQGAYENGTGEQKDLRSAEQFLLAAGFKKICFAGYSFGAWVGMRAITDNILTVMETVLISPPVDFISFEPVSPVHSLRWIISGDSDTFAIPEHIQDIAPKWCPTAHIHIIDNCDHFYSGKLSSLKTSISSSHKKRIS